MLIEQSSLSGSSESITSTYNDLSLWLEPLLLIGDFYDTLATLGSIILYSILFLASKISFIILSYLLQELFLGLQPRAPLELLLSSLLFTELSAVEFVAYLLRLSLRFNYVYTCLDEGENLFLERLLLFVICYLAMIYCSKVFVFSFRLAIAKVDWLIFLYWEPGDFSLYTWEG